MIPIYRAKKIDSNECVEGAFDGGYKILTKYKRTSFLPRQKSQVCYEYEIIDPSTLEISDGKKWRKLSECNFKTDKELDRSSYNGFCDGWNNAKREERGEEPFKKPHEIAKQMKLISDETKVTGIQK